ncbi:MAG: T9SS type A sorting domain-containing protein [Bacteroidota bacterium]|nr:T9SS type A sorting domain-containing protein [Bacteroidota bacterium]
MKKRKLLTLATILCMGLSALVTNAQITVVTIQDSISTDTKWACDKQYLLKGYIYVTAGATLTIDPGTIIKGDKNSKGTLIIERGAKIMAAGTLANPIVFTSNQAAGNRSYGDWGGLVICGSAPTNWIAGQGQVEGGPRSLYGGTNAQDNSGILTFVRLEFGGIAFSPNNEVNGLTLCGVGEATTIHHIQVSYCGDDSYEWFGGNVNAKYLVSYRCWDDDFDNDVAYKGKNQFLVSMRDPYAADQSGSKCFESDSYLSGTKTGLSGDTSGLNRSIYANVTAVGPLVSPTSTAYDPQFIAAAHIRRGSSMSILNSLLIGYPAGILIDESSSSFGSTVANLQDSLLEIAGVVIAGIPSGGSPAQKEVMYVVNGARNLTPTNTSADTVTGNPFAPYDGPFSWFNNKSHRNKIYANAQNGLKLQSPFNLVNPNFVPTSSSAICYNSKGLPSYMTDKSHFATTDPFSNGKTYPFNATKPINTDTSNWFANYNAPDLVPSTSPKLSDPFFDKVNYLGAFSGTQTTSDDWTKGWCNFDPVNTDYSGVCNKLSITKVNNTFTAHVFPNPAHDYTTISISLTISADVMSNLYDVTGKLVYSTGKQNMGAGQNYIIVNTAQLPEGIYYNNITSGNTTITNKIVVVK